MKTLDEVRGLVAEIASTLDPDSRYVPELLARVDSAADVDDLVRRMAEDSRGARHAGRDVFARMTIEQQVRCQLITNETVLFRFSEGEWSALVHRLLPRFAARAAADGGDRGGEAAACRILSAPCSHGEEPFSLAAACLQLGIPFRIDALDIQPACIEEARTGRLTMGFPAAYLESPAVVGPAVRERIDFRVGDLLDPLPGNDDWDLVVCRNFLGYFQEKIAVDTAARLAVRVRRGGALFLDSFCLAKFPGLVHTLVGAGLRRDGEHPVFVR